MPSSCIIRDNDCKQVAFGLDRYLYDFQARLAPNAEHWRDLGPRPTDDSFADDLLDMMETADAIHFNLSRMSYLNTPDGVLAGPPHLNGLGSTNWELRTIWDNPSLLNKTTFYRDGRKISISAIRRLH
ncbi:MAG: hypothetical protein FJX77_13705 [Armatimonadetes bacterium]|nr:hypothetical protein [Armatimonadota bacterium]